MVVSARQRAALISPKSEAVEWGGMLARSLSIAFCLLLEASASRAAPARQTIEGVWRNRPNTLVVRIEPCGPALCGTVLQAAEDARESVRRAGTPNLVGTRILTGLRQSSSGTYMGEIFNPNLNVHAAGTLTLESPSLMLVKGCVLAGLICRQQHWTRIG
jgi:uncharacterized protein (DUF2147 family)